MIRYEAKPEQAGENQRLIEGVFDELHRSSPAGVSYTVVRMSDGVSFMHVATVESDDGPNGITQLATFAEFQKAIQDRIQQPPASEEVTLVGTYNALGKGRIS